MQYNTIILLKKMCGIVARLSYFIDHEANFLKWKAFVEFNQISFLESVLEDVTGLQIDNFHSVGLR